MDYVFLLISAILIITASILVDHFRLLKIARSRGKADICGYARSFDFRNTNTKIMRAVFNEIQDWAGRYDGAPFPVEADDSFESLYRMDPDDLDDIYYDIAEELGIGTHEPERNPYFNRVKTVKDLVLFLHEQPLKPS